MATDNQVNIVLTADNQTKRPISEVGSALGSLTGVVKTFALTAAAAFSAKAVFDFGREAVQAFGESQAAMARVNTTLNTMIGELGSKTIDEARTKIDALAKSSLNLGFDDETTTESLTRFFQATKDITKAQELNAIAMDLARAKSLDLATATNLVNQVLSGNGRVLKQYQINIKDTATPLEALGQLHDQVRGQAEAFAETLPGKLEILGQKWTNVKEAIGGALAEGLTPFLDQMLVIVSDPRFMDMLKEMAIVVGQGLLVVFRALSNAINDLTNWFTGLFILWDQINKFLNDSFIATVNTVNAVVDSLRSSVDALASGLSRVVSLSATIGGKVGGAIQAAASLVTGKRAEGGPVLAGGAYLVGERGPEIFTPGVAGLITPNRGTLGGQVFNITITGNTLLDGSAGEKLAGQIMKSLRHNLRFT